MLNHQRCSPVNPFGKKLYPMPLSLILLLVTLSIILIVVLIHYETLRLLSTYLPKLSIQPRLRILIVIYGTFCAHLLEIALFGVGYYLFGHCNNED
mgnify:CR=1 FL=1